MTSGIEEHLYQMPSVRSYMQGIVEDISNRRSILGLLPVGIDPGSVLAHIQKYLWHRDFFIQELNLLPGPNEQNPETVLAEGLGLHWRDTETPHTLINVANNDSLPEVIILGGLDNLPGAQLRRWMAVFDKWAQISPNLRIMIGGTPNLSAIAPAENLISVIPESNVYLAFHWWWGLPSILETHLLCRLIDNEIDFMPAARWREYILPSLALGDINLVEYLWTAVNATFEELIETLCQYAAFRNWDENSLVELHLPGVGFGKDQKRPSLTPPVSFQELWSKGILSFTPEYGLEIHTAALAVLKRKDMLRYRIWRGQSELLLPILDGLRLRVCRNLTDHYGSDWPIRWDQPNVMEDFEAVQEDPMATSWGYLEHLLKTVRDLYSQRDWLPIVSACRTLRNHIAHSRTVKLEDYEYIRRELDLMDIR